MLKIEVGTDGKGIALYSDDLAELISEGSCKITRASNIEPVENEWFAFMLDGTKLGPFKLRSEAREAEVKYLEEKLFKE